MTEPTELYRRLLADVDELRHDEPGRAVPAAESARDLVARLDPARLGGRAWTALQVEAWAVLASACRAAGDLDRAEEALLVALRFADAGPWVELGLRARLAQRAAYVRRDQGRFEEALRLADEAAALFREAGDPGGEAGAVVDRGLVLGRAGRRGEAVATLVGVLERLEPGSRNALAAVHAVALYLDELAVEPAAGDAERATADHWLGRALAALDGCPDSLWRARTRILLGRALGRRGERLAARRELEAAAIACARLGAPQNEGVAVLSLAELELAAGDMDAAQRLAGRLFPLLRRLGNAPGAGAALAVFCRAARARRATAELAAAARRALDVAAGAARPG